MNTEKFSTGIIGTGKVAYALAEYLCNKGVLQWVLGRDEKSLEKIRPAIKDNVEAHDLIDRIYDVPNFLIFAVSDDSIGRMSMITANYFSVALKNKNVFHLSGFQSRSLLDNCKTEGANTASVHPYQTFYNPAAEILGGVPWGIECDDGKYETFSEFVEFTGGNAFSLNGLSPEQKILYHASAVATSNYMNVLVSVSSELAKIAGVRPGDFIPKILQTTTENIISSIEKGGGVPMTGPVARGDADVVINQYKALNNYPELLKSFREITSAAIDTAYRNGILDDKTFRTFVERLEK